MVVKKPSKENGLAAELEKAAKMREMLKAVVIVLGVLRILQSMRSRNKSIVKISDALQKGVRRLHKLYPSSVNKMYDVEQACASKARINLVYTVGNRIDLEPATFVMYALDDNAELLSKFFKINYKYVEKLASLADGDKAIKLSHYRMAEKYLDEFRNISNKYIYAIWRGMEKGIMEKFDKVETENKAR